MSEPEPTPTGIQRAIAEAQSQTALADLLGCSQQAVAKWDKRGWVPIERAKQIAEHFPIPVRDLIDPKLRELTE